MRTSYALVKKGNARATRVFETPAEAWQYAKATLENAWRTLRAFLSWCTVEADLPRNPAQFVRWDVDARSPKPKTVLNRDEVTRLLAAAKAESDPSIHIMTVVGLVGAMRSSELSALERSDVDLEKGTVSINRSHTEGTVGKPKTLGSRRTVILPPEVVEEMKIFLAWQDENEVKGRPVLFPTSWGTRRTPSSFNDALARCATKAGIDKHVTSHALRRTANNLLRQTAGEIVARAVTGHVTQQMTAHYSDVDRDERTAALHTAFGGAFGRSNASA